MHIAALMTALLALSAPLQGQPQAPPADSVPAPTNVQGAQYPRLTPDLRAVFRIKAPDAQKVEFAFFNPRRVAPQKSVKS